MSMIITKSSTDNSIIEVVQENLPNVVNSVKLDTDKYPHAGDVVLNISEILENTNFKVLDFKPGQSYKKDQLIIYEGTLYVVREDFIAGEEFNKQDYKLPNEPEEELPVASDTIAGISKLYSSLGENEDGSITQKIFTDKNRENQENLESLTSRVDEFENKLENSNQLQTIVKLNLTDITNNHKLENIIDTSLYDELYFTFLLNFSYASTYAVGSDTIAILNGSDTVECYPDFEQFPMLFVNSSSSNTTIVGEECLLVNSSYAGFPILVNHKQEQSGMSITKLVKASMFRINDSSDSNIKWTMSTSTETLIPLKMRTGSHTDSINRRLDGYAYRNQRMFSSGFLPDFDGLMFFTINESTSSEYPFDATVIIKGVKKQ